MDNPILANFLLSGWTERFRMYREGDRKIVKKNDEDWELYNLKDDPTEIMDLSTEKTEIIIEMENSYNAVQMMFKEESE